MKVLTLFPTRGVTLVRSPMTVATVRKDSIIKQTLISISESIQGRNAIPALSVRKTHQNFHQSCHKGIHVGKKIFKCPECGENLPPK